MKIHGDFIGGNIKVIKENENNVYLENEIRDSGEDWFYWAFCVEGACGMEITFHIGKGIIIRMDMAPVGRLACMEESYVPGKLLRMKTSKRIKLTSFL